MDKATGCDRCTEDQVRCRFNPLHQNSCRGCVALNIPCNWTRTLKPRPPPDISYVKYLEARTKLVETHLKNLQLGVNTKKDIDRLLEQESCSAGQEKMPITVGTRSLVEDNVPTLGTNCLDSPALAQLVQRIRLLSTESSQETQNLIDHNALWIESSSTSSYERMFHGHSSAHVLSRDAAAFRQEHSFSDSQYQFRSEFWKPPSHIERQHAHYPKLGTVNFSREELPPADLLPMLLDAYFDNAFFPVVHRGLFEKQLGQSLHEHEPSFLRLVLLVCANGAKWCQDPRVLDERWPVPLSAGYRWFRQLDSWPRTFLTMTRLTLWDAQSFVLAASYLCGSSEAYGTWIIAGTAIRMMQDIGSHRMRSSQTLENELHKRCFWSMLLIDRYYGVHLGRNPAMFDWDSDLDSVLDVDDDIWPSNPAGDLPPVQPSGVVSRLSIFNQVIGLTRLYGRCLQTVYTPDRTKHMLGLGKPQGLSWAFNDINSRLKDWAQRVPSNLQLPHPEDYNTSPSFASIITMWGIYYELVISANRSLITRSSPLALPALSICRRAAREFAKMSAAYFRIPGSRPCVGMVHPAFSSAMILVIDLFAETGDSRCAALMQSLDEDAYDSQQKEMDLRTCINVLERSESCFHMAGRLRDVIGDFETSLQSHSASTHAPTLESRARTLGANHPADITFDIEGPPDVFVTLDNIQGRSKNLLQPSTEFTSLYEFANPFFQIPGCSHSYGFPSTYKTPTPPHTLFPQTSSVMQEQSFYNVNYLEVDPSASNNIGYTTSTPQHSLEREVWGSLFPDSVQHSCSYIQGTHP